ncbi:MAG TPA: hypothetical protein VNU97_13790 [Rhizomicrobium sp.]|jgi:hypothetical protein|nr:hypothetical protein [Rhizomicrobium sp.]
MQKGSAIALAAFLATGFAASASAFPGERPDGEAHRLYDRQADCALFDIAGAPARAATWDGPCMRGLASGRGTAVFFSPGSASRTITAEFRDGAIVDGKAEIGWSDGAHYSGDAQDGSPSGAGVLVDGSGNRFVGAWKDGALNGQGSVVWANGDRYDGAWLDGKAEGRGVQLWADGQKYDGLWHNDLPNGAGILTRKDGTQIAATFVDGKRQAAANAPAASPVPMAPTTTAAAPGDAANPGLLFAGLAGATLTGVDGSSLALAAKEGGLVRTVTAPDGSVQAEAFTFLGNGLGTVSDTASPPQVVGFFRVTPAGLEIEYGDGRSERFVRAAPDGLSVVLKSAQGDLACTAWYPAGHIFSAEERKAAVAAYARRLGVSDAPAVPRAPCPAAGVTPVSAVHPVAPSPAAHRRALHAPRETAALAAPAAFASGLQTVPVKPSTVHLIDAPQADAAVAGNATVDERIASNCLKVDSDGAYWGFRNHCGYSVQFAYCLQHGSDAMTACGANGGGSVPGSVSANGFGALFADTSLVERGVEHDFRWVGCRGGAGEVAARLDEAEPASGRCLSAGATRAN